MPKALFIRYLFLKRKLALLFFVLIAKVRPIHQLTFTKTRPVLHIKNTENECYDIGIIFEIFNSSSLRSRFISKRSLVSIEKFALKLYLQSS